MLQELSADQARQIADLAKTARTARDVILDNVPELWDPGLRRWEFSKCRDSFSSDTARVSGTSKIG